MEESDIRHSKTHLYDTATHSHLVLMTTLLAHHTNIIYSLIDSNLRLAQTYASANQSDIHTKAPCFTLHEGSNIYMHAGFSQPVGLDCS
jgi:hypothetical protein